MIIIDNKLLCEKAVALQTGIFTDFSNSIQKFPTCIVKILSTDNEGYFWFVLPRPFIDIGGIKNKFFAQLDLFNKNHNFYLKLNGIASIENGFKEFPGKPSQLSTTGEDYMIIKFQLCDAVLTKRSEKKTSFLRRCLWFVINSLTAIKANQPLYLHINRGYHV